MGGGSDPNVTFVTIFSCEARLNKCTFVSVCPSVGLSGSKLNLLMFGQLMTANDSLGQLLTTFDKF